MSTGPFADVHDDLRSIARDLLGSGDHDPITEEHAGPAPGGADRTAGHGPGADPDACRPADAVWPTLAAMGWLGLEVPEDLGGSGATFAEVAVVAEELGRALATTPYLGPVVLGVGACLLVRPGDGVQERDALAGDIAAGARRVAVAIDPGAAVGRPVPFRIRGSADGLRLSGALRFVADLGVADRLLVVALDATSEPVVVDVATEAPGVTRTPTPVVDATRGLGDLDLVDVPVRPDAVWRFATDPTAAVAELAARGALAVTCDSLGVAERMLAATVDHVGQRHQFGRPIGSFQAVKHTCADMAVQLSVGRALVRAAVDDLVAGGAGHPASVAMAQTFVTGAAVDIAGAAMQLHGGIGYTWEGGVHRFLKRATLNRSLFGSRQQANRLLARRHLTPAGGRTPAAATLRPSGARP